MADRPGFWLLTRAVTARAILRTAVSALAPARAGCWRWLWLNGSGLAGVHASIRRMGSELQAAADAQAVAVWAQYSKERYDAAERRIADFRGWARQLAAAAIGVVVGLEAALMGQLGKAGENFPIALAACLTVLLVLWRGRSCCSERP